MSKRIRLIRGPGATFPLVVDALTRLQGRVQAQELAVVRIPFSMVVWETFPAPSCGLPGADVGQCADARLPLPGGRSLHLQRFIRASGDVIEAHLDDHDACTAPVEHAAHATRAIEYGVGFGLGVGLITYALTGNKRDALTAGGLSAGGGFYLGAHTPTQTRRVFDFNKLTNPTS